MLRPQQESGVERIIRVFVTRMASDNACEPPLGLGLLGIRDTFTFLNVASRLAAMMWNADSSDAERRREMSSVRHVPQACEARTAFRQQEKPPGAIPSQGVYRGLEPIQKPCTHSDMGT